MAGRLKAFWRDQCGAFRRLFGSYADQTDWQNAYTVQLDVNRTMQTRLADYERLVTSLRPGHVARMLGLRHETVAAADRWYAEHLTRLQLSQRVDPFDWSIHGHRPPPLVRTPPSQAVEWQPGDVIYRVDVTETGPMYVSPRSSASRPYPDHEPEDL